MMIPTEEQSEIAHMFLTEFNLSYYDEIACVNLINQYTTKRNLHKDHLQRFNDLCSMFQNDEQLEAIVDECPWE